MSFIFINGRYQNDLSNVGGLSESVFVEKESLTLHLPKKFQSKTPIYFVHINNEPHSQPIKRIIIAEEDCEAIIIETYQGRSQVEYTNTIQTTIYLKPNARLHYYKLQQEGKQATHYAQFIVEQSRHSYLGTYHIAKGGARSRDHFSYTLIGEGATCESIGFYQTNDRQQFEIDSRIQHATSYTNSRQLYKGMADDQSHVKFSGMVMVDATIKEICAHQRNNNLLLSTQARIDTKPELEIYSEDVRCSHGATVGQLDEEALFYLRSRGVDEVAAKELLTNGFANEIFDTFPERDIAEKMRSGSWVVY